MARLARRHFEGEPRAFDAAFYIGTLDNNGQTKSVGDARDKPLVRITAASAQAVVEMRNGELPFVFFGEVVKQMQQRHRIHAAGNRDKNFLPAPKKSERADILVKKFRQTAHVGNANASAGAGKVIGMLNQLERLELSPENRLAAGLEPVLEHRCIHAAEIDRVFDVALEQIRRREAGILAEQTGFDAFTHNEHRRGGAMVGAGIGVVRDAAAEFAKGHQQHALHVALRFHVVDESFY